MITTKDLYCQYSLHIFDSKLLKAGSKVEWVEDFANLYGSYKTYKEVISGETYDILKSEAELYIKECD